MIKFKFSGNGKLKKNVFKNGTWNSEYMHQEIIRNNASISVVNSLIKINAVGQNHGNYKGEAHLIITNLPKYYLIFIKFKRLNIQISSYLQFGIGSSLYCSGGTPSIAMNYTKPVIFADTVKEIDGKFDLFLSVYANSQCSLEIQEIWLEKIEK